MTTSQPRPRGIHRHRPRDWRAAGWAFIAVALGITCGWARAAAPVSVQKQVEAGIMCICPDNCGKVLVNCFCSYSEQTRAKIRALMDQGLDADAIMARFVSEQGKVVLAAPTTKGFDLAAWVLPFAALAVAIPVVVLVIRRLGTGNGGPSAESPAAPGSAAARSTTEPDAELEARLERELDGLDH